jgi:hypothetical protein
LGYGREGEEREREEGWAEHVDGWTGNWMHLRGKVPPVSRGYRRGRYLFLVGDGTW